MTEPDAATFAEGQRAVALKYMTWAGIYCGLMDAALLLGLWVGGWTVATEGLRIMYIALLGAGFPLGMIFVIGALAVGGPVGRFKAKAGRDGGELEIDGDANLPTSVKITEIKA